MSRPILAAVGTLAIAACGGTGGDANGGARGPQGGERGQRFPAVEAVEVRYGSLPLEERLAGSVRARNQTDIYPEVAGTIAEVFVDDGDRVETGDPLVRLRSADFEDRLRQAQSGLEVAEARVRQAEANLARLQATLERVAAIHERGLGTAAELDTARADVLSAEADLELVRAQRDQAASLVDERRAELDETTVRAPITGIVGGRNAEVGQQASTSTPLFVIGDTDQMRVVVTLTQRMLGYIDAGTSVNIVPESDSHDVVRAAISRVSPFLHPVTHTTQAEIDVEQADGWLRPGMFVTVDVLYGESEQAALVPNSAIYRHPRDGREGVFVASLDEAMRDPEQLGTARSAYESGAPQPLLEPVGPATVRFMAVGVVARGRTSSAIDGVQPGEWVVTLGHHLLASDDQQQALVQPTPWEHILSLQQLQSRDLLGIIEAKQNASAPRPLLN